MNVANVGQKLVGRAYKLPEHMSPKETQNLKTMMATLGDQVGFRPDGTLFVTEKAAQAVNTFSKVTGLKLEVIG